MKDWKQLFVNLGFCNDYIELIDTTTDTLINRADADFGTRVLTTNGVLIQLQNHIMKDINFMNLFTKIMTNTYSKNEYINCKTCISAAEKLGEMKLKDIFEYLI